MTKLGAGRFSCQVHPRACRPVLLLRHPSRCPSPHPRPEPAARAAIAPPGRTATSVQGIGIPASATWRPSAGRLDDRAGKKSTAPAFSFPRTCGRREPDRQGKKISATRSRGPRPARRQRRARCPAASPWGPSGSTPRRRRRQARRPRSAGAGCGSAPLEPISRDRTGVLRGHRRRRRVVRALRPSAHRVRRAGACPRGAARAGAVRRRRSGAGGLARARRRTTVRKLSGSDPPDVIGDVPRWPSAVSEGWRGGIPEA